MSENQNGTFKNIVHSIHQGGRRTHSFFMEFTEFDPRFDRQRFTVHYPSQVEEMQIGVKRSGLLMGQMVDDVTYNLAHMMATLDTVLDEKPTWFDVNDPGIEYDMLWDIYSEFHNWRDSFRNRNKTNGNTENSGDRGSSVPMVGNENLPDTTN